MLTSLKPQDDVKPLRTFKKGNVQIFCLGNLNFTPFETFVFLFPELQSQILKPLQKKRLWNELPQHFWDAKTLGAFKILVKTYLQQLLLLLIHFTCL